MWQIEGTPTANPSDLSRLLEVINRHADFFQTDAPITVGRAPGRLDLMGGIADYSGSLVLELPLAVATYAAVQPDSAATLTIRTTDTGGIDAETQVALPLSALFPNGEPLPYHEANALLTADPRAAWAAYVAGVLVVLARERGARVEQGLRVLITSEVPAGKGVSSSAAIEVAVMRAVLGSSPPIDGRELAILCQKVENLVVGAPCGVMDQMTSALGEQDRLLALLCQPAEVQGNVPLPQELTVWGIDSGIRHAVSGADYGSVRVGAFMGYRIIAELAGLAVAAHQTVKGHIESVRIDDPVWRGYLANIPPSLWEQSFRERVPAEIQGDAFLARYGGTTDTITQVDSERTYAVRQPTAHPIYEHHRVRLFRALLEQATSGEQPTTDRQQQPLEDVYALLGELMFQSHASYSACGLGSGGTDRLVELVRARIGQGVYGAKITGGGSGGTVAVMGLRDAGAIVREIAARYARESGHEPVVLEGSSPGAMAFSTVRLVAR